MTNILKFPDKKQEPSYPNTRAYIKAVMNEIDAYRQSDTASPAQKAVWLNLYFVLRQMDKEDGNYGHN